MKYRLTCLTPLLAGDGSRLSPVDYMVWKNQVNVLDQRRIFKLLAKGPRLEGYLTQIRRAEKLDFASWGGFAQNFAGRRIPFEHESMTAIWERLRAEHLHIPTFAMGLRGPYVPGSALKGALRAALLFQSATGEEWSRVAAEAEGDRRSRRPADSLERRALGASGRDRMKSIAADDSAPAPAAGYKVHLTRTAAVESAGGGQFRLAWRQSPRGWLDSRRVEESTATFAEMAPAGAVFEGRFAESGFYRTPEVAADLSWPKESMLPKIVAAANAFARRQLELHAEFAARGGLAALRESIAAVTRTVGEVEARGSCVVCLGWGTGMLAKCPWLVRDPAAAAPVLAASVLYGRAIRPGTPFPKSRRIVFIGNQPAALPGWCSLEFE
jgi:CRISPR-associated protein Csm5